MGFSNLDTSYDSTNQALGTTLKTKLAGEDITSDVLKVIEPCNMTVIDLATDTATTVCATPCVLLGVYVNVVMSAHACPIIDNVTTKLTLPASTAAGTNIDCHGAFFATNMSVNSDNAATGEIVVFWRALASL